MILSKAQLIGGAVVALAAFFAGTQVGAWKEGAEFLPVERDLQATATNLRQEISTLNQEVADLKAAVAKQNAAADLLEAQAEGAKAVQAEAQKRADNLALLSNKRLDRIAAMIPDAKSCDDVLLKYWEASQ